MEKTTGLAVRVVKEGVAHQRNVLVDPGVLKGFLYDLKTAAQAGVESTGNGARSLFSPPAPAPTNLVFETGGTPLADMNVVARKLPHAQG